MKADKTKKTVLYSSPLNCSSASFDKLQEPQKQHVGPARSSDEFVLLRLDIHMFSSL